MDIPVTAGLASPKRLPGEVMDRYTKFMLVAGAIVFLVLPPLILYAPRSDFGKACAQTCHAQGMDYEVVSLGRNALPGGYPARCDCVQWEPGAWWQFWKNDPPPAITR